MIGLTAKNAILIIEVAKDLAAQGRSVQEAALAACELRFRPIIMTSFAFILGVVPLAIATGASMNSQRAIGTGVFGGMIVTDDEVNAAVDAYLAEPETGAHPIAELDALGPQRVDNCCHDFVRKLTLVAAPLRGH